MSNKFFDADRRHDADLGRMTRFAKREAWSMDPIDFLDETIHMAGRGERRDVGFWFMFGDVRVSNTMRPYGAQIELGWHRWVLPSEDGIVHQQHDWDAPWISRSPSGALFFCVKKKQEPVDFAGLLARCSAHADRVGALQ